ncbi:interleukin-17C [Synchiropus picturatus]
MDVKVLLLLLLAAAWRCDARCLHNQTRLKRLAERWQRRFSEPRADGAPTSCPAHLLRSGGGGGIHERSLSPWRYVKKTLKDHLPETYSEAECLCAGCVLFDGETGTINETEQYNSAPVVQARTFLKKVPCRGQSGYRLEPVQVQVQVGCTCVAPLH